MIDKYGEGLFPDLLSHYGVDLRDVVAGEMAPAFVLSLIESLPEGSTTYAMMQGGEHWRAYAGIEPSYYVLSGIYNAINANTAARGNFKKKPKFEGWPTPAEIVRKLNKKAERKTVAGLYKSIMAGR